MPIETERARAMRLARTAKYKAKNRAKILSQRVIYRARTKDRTRNYYTKNAEKIKARSREYGLKNKDRIRDKNKANAARRKELWDAWKLKNKQAHAEYQKKYKRENKLAVQRAIQKRRALKKGGQIGNLLTISSWERRWRDMAATKCFWCLNFFPGPECHSDHIIPISRGGAHAIENLCISCPDCNNHKHDLTLDVWNKRIANPVLL